MCEQIQFLAKLLGTRYAFFIWDEIDSDFIEGVLSTYTFFMPELAVT